MWVFTGMSIRTSVSVYVRIVFRKKNRERESSFFMDRESLF
jgi:hypothetical protein